MRQWLEEHAHDDSAENTLPTASASEPTLPDLPQARSSRRNGSSRSDAKASKAVALGTDAKPNAKIWIVLALVALAGVAAAVWALRQPPRPTPEDSLPPTVTASPSAAPLAASEPASAPPTSGWVDVVTANSAPDALPSTQTPAAPGVQTPQSQVTEVKLPNRPSKELVKTKKQREAVPPPTPAPVLAAPGAGFLKIAVSPWGNVEIDGRLIGTSPPLTEVKLPEGKHQIVIRNDDFPAFSATIHVAPNEVVQVRHKFGN